MLPFYGTVGGRLLPNRQKLYEVQNVIEKPTPTEAEQKLIVPGLRMGHYLCYFGMHVLTPTVIDLLATEVENSKSAGKRNIQLTTALQQLIRRERYLALEVEGRRFDIAAKYGLLNAQLAFALTGKDREEVLTQLIELLARK
jgi:UTP--glucose-1-phosphate uridylyltransferase